MKEYILKSPEELQEIMNSRKWYIKMYDSVKYKIRRFVGNVRRSPRNIKYFIQRGKRGWSDSDAWNSYNYLSKVIAGQLEWLAYNKHGVGYPYYTMDSDVDIAFEIQKKDYLEKAKLFKQLSENEMALNKEWKERWGGLLQEEYDELMKWFADNFLSMWD